MIKRIDIQNVPNTLFNNNDDLEKGRIQNEINDLKEIQDNKDQINKNKNKLISFLSKIKDLLGQNSDTAQKQLDNAKKQYDDEVKTANDTAQNSINLITQTKNSDLENIDLEKNNIRENTLKPEQDRLNKLQNDKENVDDRRKDLLNEKALLEDELNKASKDNQIYRMAEKINFCQIYLLEKRLKGQIITQGELDRAFGFGLALFHLFFQLLGRWSHLQVFIFKMNELIK